MKKPKVSINKLGEYMYASATRKKTIVKDQKNPPNFKAARYTVAREAFVNYLVSKFDPTPVDEAISALKLKPTSNDYQASDRDSSIEALNALKDIDFSQLVGLEAYLFNGNGKMEISGVNVSVLPDVILRATIKGKKIVGAVKFNIAKTEKLNEKGRKVVATTLHQFIDDHVKVVGETVNCNYIFSVDVFAKKIEVAPKANAKLRSDIQASCEEYVLWWNAL